MPRGQIQTDEGVWLEDFTFIDHEEVSTVPAPVKRSVKRAGGE